MRLYKPGGAGLRVNLPIRSEKPAVNRSITSVMIPATTASPTMSIVSAASECGESFLRADKTTDQCVVTNTGGRPPSIDEGVASVFSVVIPLALTGSTLASKRQRARAQL